MWFARKAGADAVESKVGQENADTAKRIAEAQAGAAGSLSAIRDELQRGERQL